jgi:L-alanine-DL-glutamate epimerase-like enolase superfamily enzyme
VHLTAGVQTLHLAHTFTIARSSVDIEEVCIVRLEHDGITAFGEGAPVDYWGESAAGIAEAVEAEGVRLIGPDPFALDEIAARLREWDGPQGAKMALDGVVHDWFGKRLGQPLWRLFGLGRITPPTSFTIGIASVEETVGKVREATGYQVYKVKVGGPGDLERLEAIRAATPARLRIDGNEGWTSETARGLTPTLLRLGVEFVEQPFPADDLDSYRRYRELPERLPVLIDEGCKDLRSLRGIADYADGIVVKLSKCGGIREAHRMIHAARAFDLQVMVGCMIESALGISQAAQLTPLVDHVDLDGHLLITDAPFTGLGLDQGRLVLSGAPGLGVAPAPGTDPVPGADPATGTDGTDPTAGTDAGTDAAPTTDHPPEVSP